MTLMQLAHCNIHVVITAIAYHACVNFPESTSASGAGRTSTVVRLGCVSRSAFNCHGTREEMKLHAQIEEESAEEAVGGEMPSKPRT
jgi:hypothetical protein